MAADGSTTGLELWRAAREWLSHAFGNACKCGQEIQNRRSSLINDQSCPARPDAAGASHEEVPYAARLQTQKHTVTQAGAIAVASSVVVGVTRPPP
jgi:hypothetical protein